MWETGAEVTTAESGILRPGVPPAPVGYLARQPILNRRGGVLGYGLRYHDPAGTQDDANSAAGRGLIDALSLFGVERFTGGHLAFIRCTAQMFLDDLLEGLPRTMTVLEFPSLREPSAKLLRACRRLREAGFRLALAGAEPGAIQPPWMEEADYVKIDVTLLGAAEWKACGRQDSAVTLIAENIQTHEAYRAALAAGVHHFQGLYFCRPDLIPDRKIPANRLCYLEILRELFKDPLNLKKLCPLVECDPSLIYRVLRLVNSPVCAIRQPVTSIESAILILGDAAFRRIAALAIQCGLNQGYSPELVNMALVRGRFCAAAAPLCGFPPEEQYLLGMLSLLPPMLGVPMEAILPALPLRGPIQEALAGIPVRERCLLAWIEELEQDRTLECDSIAASCGLDRDELVRAYLASLDAANRLAVVANQPA